jgi:hypothetical protein
MSEFSDKMDKLSLKMIAKWITKASLVDTSTERLTYINEILLELVTPAINIEIIKDLYDMYDEKTAQKDAIATLNIAYPNPNAAN